MTTVTEPHFLQSNEWAENKSKTKWKTILLNSFPDLKVYRRKTPIGGVIYIPGFMLTDNNEIKNLTQSLLELGKNNVVAKIEPCSSYDENIETLLIKNGWQKSRNIQYSHTVLINLTDSLDGILASMKTRARREIKKASEYGVTIKEIEPSTANLIKTYKLLNETSKRKKFTVRDEQEVIGIWQSFANAKKLKIYNAVYDTEVISTAVVLLNGKTKAWYKDGASVRDKSNLFGTRLMLFEIIKDLKQMGYDQFDLGGIPNPETRENSHMSGIYTFKTAFSTEITAQMPAFELPLSAVKYNLWPKFELGQLKLAKIRHKMWY